MTARRHAEIAGAGFAGLVAAIALADRGWTVRVHERAEALRAFGAGIFIWENGLRVLKAIGAYDAVIAGSLQPRPTRACCRYLSPSLGSVSQRVPGRFADAFRLQGWAHWRRHPPPASRCRSILRATFSR